MLAFSPQLLVNSFWEGTAFYIYLFQKLCFATNYAKHLPEIMLGYLKYFISIDWLVNWLIDWFISPVFSQLSTEGSDQRQGANQLRLLDRVGGPLKKGRNTMVGTREGSIGNMLRTVYPHFCRYHVCEFIHLLKFICNPKINSWSFGKKFESPGMRVTSWGWTRWCFGLLFQFWIYKQVSFVVYLVLCFFHIFVLFVVNFSI